METAELPRIGALSVCITLGRCFCDLSLEIFDPGCVSTVAQVVVNVALEGLEACQALLQCLRLLLNTLELVRVLLDLFDLGVC